MKSKSKAKRIIIYVSGIVFAVCAVLLLAYFLLPASFDNTPDEFVKTTAAATEKTLPEAETSISGQTAAQTTAAAEKTSAASLTTLAESTAPAVDVPETTVPEQVPVAPTIPDEPDFDVIVAGGDPEGIAAAIAAAQNGMKVLLVCEDNALGGLFTISELNVLDLGYVKSGLRNVLANQGFFEKFFKACGNSFDLEEAKAWFMKQVNAEKNITLLMNAEISEPIMSDKTIIGLTVTQNGEKTDYYSRRVIDATTDADVAAAAGVPFSIGMEDYGNSGYQAVTLVFELSGVSYEGVREYVKEYHARGDYSVGIDAVSAWGYGAEAKLYEPIDDNLRLRGPNIGFQKNGNVLINALLICGVNALDEESYNEGIERAKAELPNVIKFMREHFKGFENCELVRTAEKLYVRETRHIYGEYRLTIDDVLEYRDFDDKIALGCYPVDIQPVSAKDYGSVVGNPVLYAIPYRCTVPLEIENLWVVGRSASYDSLPHGSTRTVPIGMSVAEGIGVACAWSVKNDISPREMCNNEKAMNWVQARLEKRGAYLIDINAEQPEVMSHWAYEGLKVIRSIGMIHGGYDNDYKLEAALGKWSTVNMCKRISKLLGRDYSYFDAQVQVMAGATNEDVAYFAAYILNGNEKPADRETAIKMLEDAGIINDVFYDNYGGWQEEATKGEVCWLLGMTYKYIVDEQK